MIKRLDLLSTFESNSAGETIDFAYNFSKRFKKGDLILLSGDIGVGKTTFLNGVLRYLGSKKKVISSSFVLVTIYYAKKLNLVHCDFYRIDGNYDISEIMEYLSGNNIVAIEWPYDIKKYVRFKPYLVKIKVLNLNKRLVEVYKYD